jgi:hypothetical protein
MLLFWAVSPDREIMGAWRSDAFPPLGKALIGVAPVLANAKAHLEAAPGTDLDVLEERYIRQFGGPRNASNPDAVLENLRHQMRDARYQAATEGG